MLQQQYTNSRKQGDAGLGIAISWYACHGVPVSLPLTDSQEYDLIIDQNGVLERVQVKTCLFKRTYFEVMLSTQGGNRKNNYISKTADQIDYDRLFISTGDSSMYEIPKKDIAHIKRFLRLGPSYDKYRLTW